MTLTERLDAFQRAFPKVPRFQLAQEGIRAAKHEVIYGQWVPGRNFGGTSPLHGSYPPSYLRGVGALFSDVPSTPQTVMHVFSGSLPAGEYSRCDEVREAEYLCNVYDLPRLARRRRWTLGIADPPYSKEDAKKYGTKMVNRRRAMASLAQVIRVGGHLVWLDEVWPQHRKEEWRTVGRITITLSTNRRLRSMLIFERIAA